MIKSKSHAKVVTAAITPYSAGASEQVSIDAQGNLRVALTSGAGGSSGQLTAAATQVPLIASLPLQWTLTNAPAVNTIATATKAAGGAGVRHVLTSVAAFVVSVTAANFTANQPAYFVVRDGATGVGTILWQSAVGFLSMTQSGLAIVGTANTAMTIEWTVAPGLTNFEVVSASGYSIALA